MPGYDYSQNGAYFVTICTKDRKCVLSKINAPVGAVIGRPPSVRLLNYGDVVNDAIIGIQEHYSGVFVDKYVIMPNHIHLIIIIDRTSGRPMTAPTLSWIINQFKGIVAKRIGHSIWQRSYYEHVIRNDKDYLAAWQYIDGNPAKWADDEYYN